MKTKETNQEKFNNKEPKQTDEKGSPLTYWGGLEESKQELEKEMFELEQELDIPSNLRWHNSKPKQERSYSEEEVLDILFSMSVDNPNNITKWFEHFKKK